MKMYQQNINQQIREYLTTTFEISRTYGTEDCYKKKVQKVFANMQEKEPKVYCSFLGTIFSDYFKMLYAKKQTGSLSDEEEGSLIFFESLKNINTLKLELELMPDFLVDMVNESINFNKLNFFEKRKIFQTVKDKNAFLQRINPGHVLDQIYYCKSYDPDLFISMYNRIIEKHKDNDIELAKDLAIESLSSLYEELKIYDPRNQEKLGFAMIRDYYIFKKYEFKTTNIDTIDQEIIKRLEQEEPKDLDMLSNEFDSTDTTRNIIRGFIEYNTERSSEYRKEAEENLKNNVSREIKTKLHYDRRRKTVS